MHALMKNSETLKNTRCTPLHDGLPIPEQPTEQDRQVAKTALRLSQDKKTVLFAGQIVERKGVADIIEAWQKLPEPIQQNTELVIVGDDLESGGAYKRQMESLANALNVAARFVGFQKNVPTWLTAADLVLVPSHAEPLGNATLEAMALGRPVIGANVGGIPEMILHDQTGMLIPPKNPDGLAAAIEKLIKHPERLKHWAMQHAYGACPPSLCNAILTMSSRFTNGFSHKQQTLSKLSIQLIELLILNSPNHQHNDLSFGPLGGKKRSRCPFAPQLSSEAHC